MLMTVLCYGAVKRPLGLCLCHTVCLSGMFFPLHMAWLSLVCASALSSHASSSKQTSLILSKGVTLSLWILQPPGLPAVMAPVSLYSNNIYQPGQLPPLNHGLLEDTIVSGVSIDSLVLCIEPGPR